MTRILFDHGTPAPLRRHLAAHEVDLARDRGWDTCTNGELLDSAEADGYEVLISTDRSIPHQQDLGGREIAVIVVPANWRLVQRLIRTIESAVEQARPGTCVDLSRHAKP